MKPASYYSLDIYKQAHRLALQVHRLSLAALPAHERYEEASQIRRSSKSVSLNIVEGFARRRYKAEFVRFLIYAYGSCEETVEHLLYLKETGSLETQTATSLIGDYQGLSCGIYSFIASVERQHQT